MVLCCWETSVELAGKNCWVKLLQIPGCADFSYTCAFMRKRKYNLVQRFFIKANSVLYTLVGKLVDKTGTQQKFPYEVKGHFGDVTEVTHEYPENFQPEHKALFDEWKWYETFPHDLFFVKDVQLSSDGIVLKKHRTFIKTLPHPIFRFQFGILYNLKARFFYRRFKIDPSKNYLLLFDNWSWNNYFHWIIDALCRAELLRENVKMNFTVLLPEASPKYLTETLKLYGFTDIVYLPRRTKTKISNLYSMNYAAWSGQQHPVILKAMVDFVKGKVLDSAQTTGTRTVLDSASSGAGDVLDPADSGDRTVLDSARTAGKRIYVSRSKQFSRRVENEKELLAVLEKYGFETVYFEGMTVAEQVRTMSEARFFVTSHGANMTNLAWLPEGAKIFELLNDRKPNFCYWSVASCLGHAYYYQLCPITNADHVLVDIETFEKNLQALLNG